MLREKIQVQMGVNQDTKRRTKQDLLKEVFAFRVLLRKKGYLIIPKTNCNQISLSGKPLDHDLIHFSVTSRNLRAEFLEKFLEVEQNKKIQLKRFQQT